MKGDKTITGIIVILTMILMGGTVGMATSYYLATSAAPAVAQGESFRTLDQELEQRIAEPANTEDIENKIESPIEQKQPKMEIHTEHMEELQQALDIWKEIMFQTAEGALTHEDAGKLLYSLSGDVYRRNLPEAFSTYWMRSVIKHRKDPANEMKEIQFSEVGHEKNGMVLVNVVEVYAKTTASYQLKLKKENGQWRFITQIL